MKATAAISIAALAAALMVTPSLALDLNLGVDANANADWLESNDIDADSVIAIDVGADGSVEVYEG